VPDGHVIVVIDDNAADLRLARRILKTNPEYFVIEAQTGRDGLKAIYNYHPDLVLLDMVLPDMDGFSILETLQNDPKLREIPVVVFSGKDVTREEREQYQLNIRSIIKKASLDHKQLLDIIKSELS
jgi:threonine synthase